MDLPLQPKVDASLPLRVKRWPLDEVLDEHCALTPRQFWTLCVAACAIALLVRLPALASRSLWLDEAYSAWFSAVPLHELWTRVPLYETHPPFYYTLLKGWRLLAGSSEAGLRSLSVLGSLATVLFMALAPRLARLGPLAERVGLLGALFLALNAGNVQFAQDARPYAMQTLTAAVAIFCSFMLLHESRAGFSRRAWTWAGLLAVSAGLTLWLHNTGIFVAFGIWTGLACALTRQAPQRRGQQLAIVGAAGLGAFLIWLPFLPMFLKQGEGVSQLAYWIKFTPSGLPSAWVLAAGGKAIKAPAVLLGLAGIYWLWKRRRDLAWHLVLLFAVAPLTMAAYSYFVKPIFLARLFEWLAPLMMATMALGAFALRPPLRKLAIAITLAAMSWATYRYYFKIMENWREMVTMIAARAQPGDLVIAFPNEVQPSIDYYLARTHMAAEIVYLPRPFPAPGMDRRYVGNLGAPAVDLPDVERVRAMVPHYRRIWLIERRADLYDPSESVAQEIERRFAPVEVFEDIGAQITLFVPRQLVARGTRPRHYGPVAEFKAEQARRLREESATVEPRQP